MKISLINKNTVKIDEKPYRVGQIVKVQSTNGGDESIKNATIKFGIYDDGEDINTNHLGFYVEVPNEDNAPLVDVINGHFWKFIK